MTFNPGIQCSALTFDMLHFRFLKTRRRKQHMINTVLHLKIPALTPTHLLRDLVAFLGLEDSLGRRRQGTALAISLNNSSIPLPVQVDHGLGIYRVTIYRLLLQLVS